MDTKTEQDPVRNEPAHAEETTDGAKNAVDDRIPDGAKYADDDADRSTVMSQSHEGSNRALIEPDDALKHKALVE